MIVTGGSIDAGFVRERMERENYQLMIAADSGMKFFYQMKILPDMIVGDFDSADPAMLDYYSRQNGVEICRLNPVKDDTDTEHAIRSAIEKGATEITLFGATGSRLDHVMGNIALLGIGLEEGVALCICDPYIRMRMIDHSITIRREEQYGRFLSLIPYAGEVTGVTLKGTKYRLNDYTMTCFNSLGISNEILEAEAQIILKKGYLLVIESRDSYHVGA